MKEKNLCVKTHEQDINVLKQGRMANLELLRCLAMMMVVVLHFLGKGNLLGDLTKENMSAAGMVAWLIECFCIVAVNVYMLISGYFLCTSSFKLSRLLQLLLQLWVYSVAVGLVGAFTGVVENTTFDTHYLLTLLFPVSMEHYWFMTAYIFLYLMLPLVGMAVEKMTKQQLSVAVGLLLGTFCMMKSVLPVRLETDKMGYDCLWYLCVFLAAAYMRKFGSGFLEKKWRGFILYTAGCLAIFLGTFLLRAVYLKTGSLERIMRVCLEYNHILPFLAAMGLFGAFCKVRIQGRLATFVNKIAPYSLGVYLLHENIGLRYSWQKWFGAAEIDSVVSLILCTFVAALGVFAAGIAADCVRKHIFVLTHKGLCRIKIYSRLVEKIEGVDALFSRKMQKNGEV